MRIDWEAKRAVKPEARRAAAKPAAEAPRPATRAKLSYKDQRDYDMLPQRIEAIDGEVAEIESAMADPALYVRDPRRFDALTQKAAALRDEKDAAEMRWLELAEQVEALG